MILVDEQERPDVDGLIERIDLLAAVVVLVRVVHQAVVVAVRQVQRQKGDVAQIHVQVRVVRRRCIRVEQHNRVREVPIRDPGDVHSARRVLLAEDCARRQAGKVDYEPGRRALAGLNGRPFTLAVLLVVAIVVVAVGVAAVAVPFGAVTVAAVVVAFVVATVSVTVSTVAVARIPLVFAARAAAISAIVALAVLAAIAGVPIADSPLSR